MGEPFELNLPDGWTKTILGRPDGGKLTDSQDSFVLYYRRIDPNRDNFCLRATFEVGNVEGVTFQTAYGLIAVDTIASPSDDSRHRNYALVGRSRTPEGLNYGNLLRIVSGYSDPEARRQKERRILDPTRLFPTQNQKDEINQGDRHTFMLRKTDSGLEASMNTSEGCETVSVPGCDFLLKQDGRWIYVGIAIAGEVGLSITDFSFETSQGKVSHTPEGVFKHTVPDYPFNRSLVKAFASEDTTKTPNLVLNVAPDGHSLIDAISKAGPGSIINLADGTYFEGPIYIPATCSAEPGSPVTLRAEHPGRAIICPSVSSPKMPAMTLRASNWILDGLVFRGASSAGLFVCGSNNVIKHCEACGNADTGILLCSFPGASRSDWPSFNRIEYCTSHDNCDSSRTNADGFGAKLSIGKGNAFYDCKAFHNLDDGFDLYTKSTIGRISPVLLERCEAAYNGWLEGEVRPQGHFRAGCGFKTGGEGVKVRHRIKQCSAHDNARDGFAFNSNPSCVLSGCKAWNNGRDFDSLAGSCRLIRLLHCCCSRLHR